MENLEQLQKSKAYYMLYSLAINIYLHFQKSLDETEENFFTRIGYDDPSLSEEEREFCIYLIRSQQFHQFWGKLFPNVRVRAFRSLLGITFIIPKSCEDFTYRNFLNSPLYSLIRKKLER